ncbi:LCP family protein [Streptomonospora salina]|uniref:LCP family protein required for cell wall assembly n=1 Tax=Streptomonospora salina TaxID=104205 RepID=A0A841EIY8_9ACTN|nr:LCP family protein [Streptomonospora salina]MBB5999381.1 LCP family protein required for cell wall assembly [Streptomonospora salina]
MGGWIAVLTTAAVIGTSLTAYAAYYDIYGNIEQQNIDTDSFGDRPNRVEGAMNIMVIGSDVRTGENADYGEAEGQRPDTLIVAHISPNNGRATLVNLPRDLIVDLPACEGQGDTAGMAAQRGMINSPLSLGGVQCQWKAVESVTGIRIDHFVSVDFTGFKGIVDSIGGVRMCIPDPIDDEDAKLHLDAGEQTLDGEESLGYMRSRYGQGDGSDVSRIKRQQEFLGAMLNQVMQGEILNRPSNITGFLSSVTETMTTDDELTLDVMSDIAIAMREVDLGNINFVTTPNGQAPENENRLALTQPQASQLFEAIAKDQSLTGDDDGGDGGGGDGDGDEEQQEQVAPGDVSVEVLNGEGTPGLAEQVGQWLTTEGFQVANTGNPVQIPAQTTIYYGSGKKAHAQALADEAVNATVVENTSLGDTVQLVLAQDWDGFTSTAGSGGGSSPGGVDGTTAEESKQQCS